ncbi:MATE family efflux transporter [Streptococcus loxodontisalivarius]|uniref:Multidrug export protein MepA n=1 Tax=Streptococcus loxodontisalivarius TaxID=1349415 RepID=A0ABS2PTK3_9STRE|nr:MATE family efflux transporter [Streptococcus loxodontisalivarius]MBM7642885.1 putative MATE family efflux protein [Streptococcus loxodontisalivarius]
MTKNTESNPLGTEKLSSLLKKFAIPAIIANIVNALYNIVDQIFIGQGVGYLGNAATNIAFPITTICTALALLIGVGAASRFNIEMGRGNKDLAKKTVGNAFASLLLTGIILLIIIRLFLKPLMISFGATEDILSYAMTYTSITSLGIPFLLISSGGSPLIRSDGSAKYSMTSVVIGAVLNTILNPIFIFGLGWGIAGSAWSTVISQIVSGCAVAFYLKNFKTVQLEKSDFLLNRKVLLALSALGLTAMFNSLSSTIVQIVTNNLLKAYGDQSIYGSDIPIAVAGIVAKVNMIFSSIIIGLTQGSQPIVGYNFGAKKLDRVRQSYFLIIRVATYIAIVAFILFEIFAPQILALFGNSSELYMTYGVKYLRIFMALVFLNGMQISTTTFYTSIGRAQIGAFLAITKQLLLLVPFSILFVISFGVDNIMFAAPLSDLLAFLISLLLIRQTLKKMQNEWLSLQ